MTRRIGLTGGIAAGKSAVGAELARLGAVVLDADALARAVVEPGERAYREVVEAFGPEVVLPDGSLNRPALATRIFADAGARLKLNAIVHPAVRARMTAETEAALRRSPPPPAVVQMIPLLLENDLQELFDEVWVVSVPEAVQRARLMERDGLAAPAAEARMNAQMPLAEKLARAHRVVDNGGPREALAGEVRRVWREAGLPL